MKQRTVFVDGLISGQHFVKVRLTSKPTSDKLSDVKITSREFQRNFTRVRDTAAAGEPVFMTSGDQEFVFQRVQKRTWQGALKDKVKITGDLHSTDIEWETDQ